ncbi:MULTISPECIES: double-strand break repair helicase AddA [Alphaproteobacteria]|uniref:DNA 3'-5' helicase n=2 Tax=Alphaproteobacteria TaxID=28211 RepID=A0A512HM89_9HYPH|nr:MULTISPECIES: double-strand break repair helicase AddA [Alphaproteobacteria]GEO86572.1 double-strand break repair helicase AddA [Ciceribacter naphthalenivorans]GLR20856.1 double-strand break repair helicase AddA [Ciceribacter naphthalenivorans]GLT03712.1 double-strand break repair helicase AddA [Sphingomonas psychrolutea]
MTTDDGLLPSGDDPAVWLDWTTLQQAVASDPARSAWVSANAGSGKTHVLTQRVIRLLLAGARPSSILCLTYTKAAASEMSNRVFSRLAEWATLPDEKLAERLYAIERLQPDRIKLAEARRLFARALETPGGLKIQTIHAFCEALLHQFPLEANVAGHFTVLDDRAAHAVLAEARRSLLTATSSEDDATLADAFSQVLSIADENGLETLLGDLVANRHAMRAFVRAAEAGGGVDALLRKGLGIGADDTEDSLLAESWPLPSLDGAMLTTYILLARDKGGKTVQEVADLLESAAHEIDSRKRLSLVEAAFLTKSGKPKADTSLIAAAMTKAAAHLRDAMLEARDHFVAFRDRLALFRMYQATLAALTLAARLDDDYEELKKKRSQLDFEDLIVRTAELLLRSDVGPWVHYKLDQGIDHILVDEAQDTSPVQWSVIRSLREDFFSGESARSLTRTFFAVGDEKQSIYSFQGARPERFSEEALATARAVAAGSQIFSEVRLPLSFRSTSAVLSAVDQVFSVESNARGLSARGEDVVHMSSRLGHPGTVDLWNMIAAEPAAKTEDWTAPFDATPESAPSAILARRIAFTVEQLIGKETIVEKGKRRPIRAGDILVLVRKRDSFVNALTRALKRRNNIPVAGADRLKLTSHIAVQDLLALGRFVLLPADDLSLAALLKSPLFNHSEEDLFELAANRPANCGLWDHMRAAAEDAPHQWRETVSQLDAFFRLSQGLPVHDFYARVLGVHGGRRAYLARLGSEVSDILDEFLSFALAFETAGLPGLQAFVSTLETEAPEVKREQDKDRDEVRIMTVHASKGLEAPIVFLVDGGGKPFNHSHLAKFRLIEARDDLPQLPVWVPNKTLANSLVEADVERRRQMAEEEYRRLLYVAMTRAADRLIICGYRGVREPGEIWHQMIADALRAKADTCREVEYSSPDGTWEGLAWRLADPARDFDSEAERSAETRDDVLPDALLTPLPATPGLPRPLSPSGAGAIIIDEADDALVTSPLFAERESAGIALQKGRLVHRMLQMLPLIAAPEREAAARRYAARAARFWPAAEREKLVQTIMAVLEHPDLEAIFSDDGQAEVSVMGSFLLNGEERAVSGRIDRMAVVDERVMLVDYKTNRSSPRSPADAPLSHRAQLAIYREILRPLYPDRQFDCLLVYTEAGTVLSLDEDTLSQSLAALKAS